MVTTYPQCNFSLEFPEILGQNLIIYDIIDRVCLGTMKQYMDGYSLTCFIVLYSIEEIITCKMRLLPLNCRSAVHIFNQFLNLSHFSLSDSDSDFHTHFFNAVNQVVWCKRKRIRTGAVIYIMT